MLKQLAETYRGKRVFLTGHTGFKGSWLLRSLSMLGAVVKGYALAPQTDNDLYHLIGGDRLCASVLDDLRNKSRLQQEILDFQPDFIFHLAAQPLVRLSYELPAETFEVNVLGTANVLDAVRLLEKPCHMVLITTDKVYSNKEWIYPYRENDRLGGYDPYSASKACAELLIDSYRNSFFNLSKFPSHRKAIAVARAGNVIGGGDWSKDRLVPDIVRSLSRNETVVIRNPNAVRPWQHVLEPVTGYLLLGLHLNNDPVRFSQAYNFGPLPEDALPVRDMLDLAIERWGSGDFEIKQELNQPHEAGLLKLDISKAVAELNWRPKMNARKAVAVTIDWYKKTQTDVADIDAFTESQIAQYLNG